LGVIEKIQRLSVNLFTHSRDVVHRETRINQSKKRKQNQVRIGASRTITFRRRDKGNIRVHILR
jgi:hypothetical protein